MSFSRYVKPGSLPINIAQTKCDDISRPQSQARKQKQDRSIPPTHRRVQIAAIYYKFHLLGLHIPRQVGKTPMSQHGNGRIQTSGTLAFGDEKAQKHAERRRTLFGCRPPTRLAFFQNKLSQASSVKRGWIFSKPFQ
jgi:hypothetical protein